MAGKTMIYKNDAWVVRRTRGDGVTLQSTARDGHGYTLDQEFITLQDWDGDWFHAPVHMAGKAWVDVPEFLDAWRVAIGAAAPDTDPEKVARSCERARIKVINGILYRMALDRYRLAEGTFTIGESHAKRSPFECLPLFNPKLDAIEAEVRDSVSLVIGAHSTLGAGGIY